MTWNKKQIYEFAKYIKTNKASATVKLDGKTYKLSSVVQILSSYILDNKKTSYENVTITPASNPTGDTINVDIIKKDYLDMTERCYNYCKTNKKAPNYITYKTKKVHYKLFAYAIAKIVVWMNANDNQYPHYVTVNSKDISTSTTTSTSTSTNNCTNPYTSTPHLLSSGCNNLGQCTGYYCGPHALMQCIYKLTGKKINESTLAGWAGTTTQGTGHPGLSTALAKFNKNYGYNLKFTWKNFSDLGKTDTERALTLAKLMCKKDTAIFWHEQYRYGEGNNGKGWGHYSLANKYNSNDKTFSVMNSLGNKCTSTSYCGYLGSRSLTRQKKYWSAISQPSIAIITK